MSERAKVACSFSGHNGDILWSLPTAQEIAKQHGPVDFYIMPAYKNLIPLLELQPYISNAYALKEWICTGSPYGDQPWEAPIDTSLYEKVYHLTYRAHPGIGAPAMQLADFIAHHQGIALSLPVVPFIIEMPLRRGLPVDSVCYAFNPDCQDKKYEFWSELKASGVEFINVGDEPWVTAAELISSVGIFVGDRSACWVLAMGLGVQTITYEPNPSRHAGGQFGKVFGCSYGKEWPIWDIGQSPQQAARTAKSLLDGFRQSQQLDAYVAEQVANHI